MEIIQLLGKVLDGAIQLSGKFLVIIGAGFYGVGNGFCSIGTGFALGVAGFWEGMQAVAKELSAAGYLIYKDSTIANMAHILAWAALLMVFPSLARGIKFNQ